MEQTSHMTVCDATSLAAITEYMVLQSCHGVLDLLNIIKLIFILCYLVAFDLYLAWFAKSCFSSKQTANIPSESGCDSLFGHVVNAHAREARQQWNRKIERSTWRVNWRESEGEGKEILLLFSEWDRSGRASASGCLMLTACEWALKGTAASFWNTHTCTRTHTKW